VQKLSASIDSTLKLTKDHVEWAHKGLGKSAGLKEPPPTPASGSNPITTEKINESKSAAEPTIDSKAILDTTLPQNKPNSELPKPHV
jgi:NAD-dependent histone deacetylase SIR2